MGVIYQDPFPTKGGEGSIMIQHSGLANDTMEIVDVGKISIEFDLEVDKDEIDEILVAPSKLEFKFWDKLDSGASFVGQVKDILATDNIPVAFSFTTDDGHHFTEDYIFRKGDVEYSAEDRTVQITARTQFPDITLTDIWANYQSDVYTLEDDSGNTTECMPVGNFVENVFNEINPNYQNRIIGNHGVTAGHSATNWAISYDYRGETFIQEKDAVKILAKLSVMCGAKLASVFGYNIFKARDYTYTAPNISYDKTEKFDFELGLRNFRSVFVFFHSHIGYHEDTNWDFDQWATWGKYVGTKDGLNDNGRKNLYLNLSMHELRHVLWSDLDNHYDVSGKDFITFAGGLFVDAWEDGKIDAESFYLPTEHNDNINMDTFLDDDKVILVGNHESGTGFTMKNANIVRDWATNSLNTRTGINLWNPLRKSAQDEVGIGSLAQDDSASVGRIEEGMIGDAVAECYAKAFGALGGEDVELVIWDLDSVDPYHDIYLDSDFPQLPDELVGVHKITYDLLEDKIEIEGYLKD